MSRQQQATQVAYTSRAIYKALRELKCAGGDRIEKGALFTRRKAEGFGDRTFNFCRGCEPFEEPSADELARFAGARRKQPAAQLLRLRDGSEVKLGRSGERNIGTLFCMYGHADFWRIAARAAELTRARSKNARLDDHDLRQAEQELTQSRAVKMLPREERMRRAGRVRETLTLAKINDGFSIEGGDD